MPEYQDSSPDPGFWRESLAALALACTRALPADEARLLRALLDLLRAPPSGMALRGVSLAEPARFAALAGAGAGESAMSLLLGKDCAFMLSRGSRAACLATVLLPGRSREASASGETAALALAGALAEALCNATAPLGISANPADRPALPLN